MRILLDTCTFLWVISDAPERFIPAQRKQHAVDALPLEEEATLYLGRLPNHHNDPFDRMLICQAIIHGLAILTPDELVGQYPVRAIW